MAFSAQDLQAIDRAIASGELSVQVGDRRIQYRSMQELLAARAAIAQSIATEERGTRGAFVRATFGTLRGGA